MDRVYQANAIETPPSTTASSGSYPTAGNKAAGQLATVPGPYWFYSITEEIRNALIAAGVTPDAAKVNQLAEAMSKFLPLSGGTMTGDITCNRANMFIKKKDTTGRLILLSGTEYGNGSSLYLNGNTYSTDKGGFQLVAHDGTSNKVLKGLPDGTLTWGGNNILNIKASSIKKQSGYLQLSNGFTLCWGNAEVAKDGDATVTFAKAFNTVYGITTADFYGTTGNNNTWNFIGWSLTNTSASFRSAGMIRTFYYLAYGYAE